MNLFEVLKFEEGYRSEPYYCSEGYPTIGIGTKIGPKSAPLASYQFSVSEKVAKAMLEDDVSLIFASLRTYDWYINSGLDRQVIITSMCYQMGVAGVMKFRNMIASLERQDWEEAAKQALDSRWARQTPERAKRHAEVLRTGDVRLVYGALI